MKVISIAAVAKNGAIGLKGQLPWNIPEDLKFFRDSTRGQMVLMGRKTFESLGKPLPQRINAILTRDPQFKAPEGVFVFADIERAIDFFKNSKEELVVKERDAGKNLFVIGGAQIYEQAMSLVDEVWLTQIKKTAEGDTFFPFYHEGVFQDAHFKISKTVPQSDHQSDYVYDFVYYQRNPSSA